MLLQAFSFFLLITQAWLSQTGVIDDFFKARIYNSLSRAELDLCSACDAIVPELRELVRFNQSELATRLVIDLCIKLKFLDQVVCENLIRIYEVFFSSQSL